MLNLPDQATNSLLASYSFASLGLLLWFIKSGNFPYYYGISGYSKTDCYVSAAIATLSFDIVLGILGVLRLYLYYKKKPVGIDIPTILMVICLSIGKIISGSLFYVGCGSTGSSYYSALENEIDSNNRTGASLTNEQSAFTVSRANEIASMVALPIICIISLFLASKNKSQSPPPETTQVENPTFDQFPINNS